MRLEDLDYFLAVAASGHVGRASETVGATQPALTKGIQRLERELQIQLFERTAKGMTLTVPGQAFYERLRAARLGIDEAVKEANDLHLGKVGLIRAGISPNYAEGLFGDACASLLRQRPAARIQVTVGLNDKLFAALRQGDLDFCLSALPRGEQNEFDQRPLFNDHLHVVAREDHPLFRAHGLRFDGLGRESWILPGPQVMARRAVEASFAERGLPPPNVVIESNSSIASLMNVVKNTNLLGITGEMTLKQAFGAGLRMLELEGAMWPRTVGIITRRNAYLSPLTKRFIELLETAAK
ncbi:transcriptional regulator, LysR family [Noviherbaspirillum humi]|uniref:Transcriptional regulator, LysR family n=1 Tax=Noviherbaspirillum humi TaxID=1688639 RepID=A0A239EYM4_9BURK|nr:LysR family transcriptional regulator [Noviherbaspirillum humi]SNS49776.1 transcriptional regulator, LysR family [Noviherbaspirillum humi]